MVITLHVHPEITPFHTGIQHRNEYTEQIESSQFGKQPFQILKHHVIILSNWCKMISSGIACTIRNSLGISIFLHIRIPHGIYSRY